MSTPAHLGRRSLLAMAWLSSGSGFSSLAKVAILAILARLLAPADFGLLGAGIVVVKFTEHLTMVGIGPSLIQAQSLSDRLRRTAFTLSMAISSIGALSMWALAPGIEAFFKIDGLMPIIQLLAVILPINGLAVVAGAQLERRLDFKTVALADALSHIFGYGLIGIVLAHQGFGVWALLAAVVAQAVVRTGILSMRSPHSRIPLLDRTSLVSVAPFSGGLGIAQIASFFALQGDKLVVGKFLGAEALGFYGRGYSLASAPVGLLGSAATRALFPAFSRLQQEPDRLGSSYLRSLALMAMLTTPLTLVAFTLGEEIVRLILGPQWLPTVPVFQVLLAGVFFRTANKINTAVIKAKAKVYRLAVIQIVFAAVVVLGGWYATRFSIAAVATAVLAALLLQFCLTTALCSRLVASSFLRFVQAMGPPLGAGAAAALALWVVKSRLLPDLAASPWLELALLAVLAQTAYLAFLAAMWRLPVTRECREALEYLAKTLRPKSRSAEEGRN